VRRVAITAFVGDGARAFIRNPKGLEIVCWPKAGGTNPLELRRLKKAGARIRFADRLHMKVYWAAKRGVVITSANLSTNALGAGDLKEFGVLLPATSVGIDDVIESLRTRSFNKHEMDRLEREHRKLMARKQRSYRKPEKVSYSEWFELPVRPEWKLGWYDIRVNLRERPRTSPGQTFIRNHHIRSSPAGRVTIGTLIGYCLFGSMPKERMHPSGFTWTSWRRPLVKRRVPGSATIRIKRCR